MRNFLLILFLIPYVCLSQIVTDGLIGYWPFQGNSEDQSGNGNDCIVNGVELTLGRNGTPNEAFAFQNNISSGIDIPDNFDISSTSWSIVLWVKPRATSNTIQYVLSFAGLGIGLYVPGGVHANYDDAFGFYSGSSHIKSVGFSVDEYYHVVLQSNGIDWFLYVNGTLVDTQTLNYTLPLNQIILGRRGDGSWPFNGDLDELMVYNRSLSEEEITLLYTGNEGESSSCSTIFCDGSNIGIGTSDTRGYKLAIAGKTITEEVKVALIQNWPDYIFENDYELRTLEEVEEHIAEKGHLPEIPSETEVTENGINLGEMNALLLQKIEELTLYLIEQNKQIKELKKEVSTLKNR